MYVPFAALLFNKYGHISAAWRKHYNLKKGEVSRIFFISASTLHQPKEARVSAKE